MWPPVFPTPPRAHPPTHRGCQPRLGPLSPISDCIFSTLLRASWLHHCSLGPWQPPNGLSPPPRSFPTQRETDFYDAYVMVTLSCFKSLGVWPQPQTSRARLRTLPTNYPNSLTESHNPMRSFLFLPHFTEEKAGFESQSDFPKEPQ